MTEPRFFETYTTADFKRHMTFEELYVEVRRKEKKIYSDADLALLPDLPPSHVHFEDWQARKKSAVKLLKYLKKKSRPLKILDVGCGNGWLSSKLADIEQAHVVGIDINSAELSQGARVFQDKANLSFEYGTLFDEKFGHGKFDVVVFAASLQYFPSLPDILVPALNLLSETGEVHILDTVFFDEMEAMRADVISRAYYTQIGYPEMSAYHFHHTWNKIRQFDYRIMYNPTWFANRILNLGPFYWLRITPDM